MALTIHINHSEVDSPLLTGGVDWIQVDTDNDGLIFSNGSDTVADGEASPGESALNGAGVVLDGTEQVFPHYFLNDASVALLKEIFLMGEGNYRYVVACVFDASTVSEPVLQVWDDTGMSTIASTVLGAGTPTDSWIKAITTTDALPGAGWTGSPLAGSSDGHFLLLNNSAGALTGSETLYFQLKCVIPATQADGGASVPIMVVKWTSV